MCRRSCPGCKLDWQINRLPRVVGNYKGRAVDLGKLEERCWPNMRKPRPVSVVMPVYNAGSYLAEAVESILNQTFCDFEFIIIDDGSTDGSGDILEEYRAMDDRIKVCHQKNSGVIRSLNRGCRLAQGPLLFRMDADDISLPRRFERQIRFLDKHPEVGVLGTWFERFSGEGKDAGVGALPTQPMSTIWGLLFGSPISHPTVAMRKAVLEKSGYYREGASYIEDRDLWLRMSKISRLMNIPEIHLRYRVHEESICRKYAKMQSLMLKKSFEENIHVYINGEVPKRSLDRFFNFFIEGRLCNKVEIQDAVEMLLNIYKLYIKKNRIDSVAHCEIKKDIIEKFLVSAKINFEKFPDMSAKLLIKSFDIDRYITMRRLFLKLMILILPKNLFFPSLRDASWFVSIHRFCLYK